MEQLLTTLSRAVEGTPVLALGASLVWGILSMILSPCHLASIPLIVGFISGQGQVTPRRAFWTATLFALGILIAITAIGGITAAAGRMFGDVGRYGNYFVALILFAVGLHLVGVIPLSFSGVAPSGMERKGYLAAFILGLVFGIALGPCTFAYMAPILAVTFKMAGEAPVFSAALLLAYGIGHCGVIVAAGSSAVRVQRWLEWSDQSKGVAVVKVICGILVMLGGVWLIHTAP